MNLATVSEMSIQDLFGLVPNDALISIALGIYLVIQTVEVKAGRFYITFIYITPYCVAVYRKQHTNPMSKLVQVNLWFESTVLFKMLEKTS